ncbi:MULTISPECIES: response regulator [unclassified Blastococcus]
MPIKVLIADDHPLIRMALGDLFEATPDIDVVAECSDGAEVLEAAERTLPDVVLMDVKMPVVDGLEATDALLRAHPEMRVVILTGALTAATAHQARALGVAGYLLKEDSPEELPARVRTVVAGGTAWSPAAAAVVDLPAGSPSAVPADGSSTYIDESPSRYR